MTRQELADYLGISIRTVDLYIAQRILPYRKFGPAPKGTKDRRNVRFVRAEIDAALTACRVPAINEPRPPKRRMGRVTDQQGAPTAANQPHKA